MAGTSPAMTARKALSGEVLRRALYLLRLLVVILVAVVVIIVVIVAIDEIFIVDVLDLRLGFLIFLVENGLIAALVGWSGSWRLHLKFHGRSFKRAVVVTTLFALL